MVFAIIGESATVSSADIELSLMAEGLLDAVNEKQAIDLFGFLMSTAPPQIPEAKQSPSSGKAGSLK